MIKQQRICIIGPSNSGKSTLATRIGRMLNLPILHLDQIAHREGSNWELLPRIEFHAKHDAFLDGHTYWIIEGNYSACMSQRLMQADTLIWCDPPLMGCIWRYIWRCFRSTPDRPGKLKDAKGEFSLDLIYYTFRRYPNKKLIYKHLIAQNPHLNLVHLRSFSVIRTFDISHIRLSL